MCFARIPYNLRSMRFLLLAWALVQAPDDPIQNLQHKDADVRQAGAVLIGSYGIQSGVLPLIELLREEKDPDVRLAAAEALNKITRKEFGDSHAEWRQWWDAEGRSRYGASPSLTDTQILKMVQQHVTELNQRDKSDIERARQDVRWILGVIAGIGVLFIVMMFYFVGHVSSRLKEWKELVGRAETYIGKSEEITKRTDHILSELEAKKADIMEFFGKAREEGQGEIERYSDMLQKSLEHKMREEIMALRQKAEKELEETVRDLRPQLEVDIRRTTAEQREKAEKALADQRERFLKEVEAHTLFLEASFFSVHAKHEDALRKYRQLLAIKPDHVMAWSNLGNACRELMRFDDAREAYEKALALAPNNPIVLYNLAATFARQRQKDKMLETLTRAIANDGEYKDEALNDPAFREFWNDPAFKDIAEG